MTTPLESLPTTWSPVDETFFRIVARLFPAAFTDGAGAVLATYDDEVQAVEAAADVPVAQPVRDAEHAVV